MKHLAKIVFVVLTVIFISSCEAEYIEEDGTNIEQQQGVDKKKIEKPGTQGGD